jgi:hypothetical protein
MMEGADNFPIIGGLGGCSTLRPGLTLVGRVGYTCQGTKPKQTSDEGDGRES